MSKIVEDFISAIKQEEVVQRDYGYRRNQEKKEQKNRKRVAEWHYFPSMPRERIGEDGSTYYIQGAKAPYKQYLKRVSNKAVRKAPLESVADGGQYRKVSNLMWDWF